MSSSRSGQESSPLQSTRQMLDDLDALMERMLALPVGDAEELPPLPRDVVRAPTVSASLTFLDEPESVQEELPREAPPTISYPAETARRPSVVEEEDVPQRDFRNFAADPVEDELPPPLVFKRTVQVVTSPDRPRLFLGGLVLMPLVWVNDSFDWGTQLLGPLGRGLRSAPGRALLGLLGLASLCGAAAWFVKEHVGWPP